MIPLHPPSLHGIVLSAGIIERMYDRHVQVLETYGTDDKQCYHAYTVDLRRRGCGVDGTLPRYIHVERSPHLRRPCNIEYWGKNAKNISLYMYVMVI